MQDQRSLKDQLTTLIELATREGLYDAADAVRSRFFPERLAEAGFLTQALSIPTRPSNEKDVDSEEGYEARDDEAEGSNGEADERRGVSWLRVRGGI